MENQNKKLILAGGCFWGMQDLFARQTGVVETQVGYTGGETSDAKYAQVKLGTTGHAEAIEITYNEAQTDLRDLYALFFQIHDPTTKDRQGGDMGSQYRSAIFYADEGQKQIAIDTIKDVEASGLWPAKVVTALEPLGPFWPAEPEHQDYLKRYPAGYTCHFPRPNWVLPRAK